MSLTPHTSLARHIRRLSLIAPLDGATVTVSFPTEEYLPFAASTVGDVHESLTLDGQYLLSVTRTGEQSWRFDLSEGPNLSSTASQHVRRGHLTVTTSSVEPTWNAIDLEFSILGDLGTFEGRMRLRAR
jgi:hypothetical protein